MLRQFEWRSCAVRKGLFSRSGDGDRLAVKARVPVQEALIAAAELKKVELLDERDQARERAEEEAREQAELDAIGMMRNGARA